MAQAEPPLTDANLLALCENLPSPYAIQQPLFEAYAESLLRHTDEEEIVEPTEEELETMNIFAGNNPPPPIPAPDDMIHHVAYGRQLMFDDLVQIFPDDQVTPHRIATAQNYFSNSDSTKFTFDWAQHKLLFDEPRQPGEQQYDDQEYSFEISHYLDFIHIHGLPNRTLTALNPNLTGFKLRCFKHWRWNFPLSNPRQIPFDITGLTFQLARNDLVDWFIIMQPTQLDPDREVPESASGTCLSQVRGIKLSAFILRLFRIAGLSNVGITHTTYLNDNIRTLSSPQFHELQRLIVLNWHRIRDENVADIFWAQHTPTFHAVTIGPNIELPGNIVLLSQI